MNFVCQRLGQILRSSQAFTSQALSSRTLLAFDAVGISKLIGHRTLTYLNFSPRFPTPLSTAKPGNSLLCRYMASLMQMHRSGPHKKFRPPRQPLGGRPFAKGVILKTLIKKPKKPNSANRKCCLVRLSGGKEMVAYIPGIGHNLQEHNMVLVRVGRTQDLPGVKIKCVRGKYDLPHVIKK